MKNKIAISMILALLMVVSTFSVATGYENNICGDTGDQECNDLDVTKKVFNGNDWVDEYTALVGETVTFKITFTYVEECGYELLDIVVKDSLDPTPGVSYTLDFTDSEYQPSETGQPIVWNLSDDYGIVLNDGQSVSISFNLTITAGSGQIVNSVEVTGLEHCCGIPMKGSDSATVTIEEDVNPEISIDKKVKDPRTDEWVDELNIYYEDLDEPPYLEFKINISNTGNVDLTHVYVTDVLPDFLTFVSASYSPNVDGQVITWGPFNLPKKTDKIGYLTVEVDTSDDKEVKTGENFVNVTAVEEGCICNCECLYDEDYVDITIKPHIIVEKKVKNESGEWADIIDYVSKSENIEFKITTTYYGEETMKCLLVFDDLPECLEYVETLSIKVAGEEISTEDIEIYIGEGETIEICGHEFTLNEGYIIWDWINAEFALKDGESVEIIFEAAVTEYCEGCGYPNFEIECWDENCALAILWGCCPCEYYMDCDCVDVLCCPPPTTFDKKGREKGENIWKDSIETTVGASLEFKLELQYYGEENLTDISFKDKLPCILEYDNNVVISVVGGDAVLETVELSCDSKTIWFNFTGNLSDSGKITITFDVNVIGSTGDCDECELDCYNYASVTAYFGECHCDELFKEDTLDIKADSNCPPEAQGISGPSSGTVGEALSFESKIVDPDGDKVRYKFKVTGGTETEWSGLVSSGTVATFTHTFEEEGTYQIKVKAKDEHGLESGWDESLDIVISEEIPEFGLEICSPGLINIKTISTCIKNTGTETLSDIDWSFTISKEGLLGGWLIETNGTIETLEGGSSKSVSSGPVTFKFGMATVNITATCGDLEDQIITKALVIGRLIFVSPMFSI